MTTREYLMYIKKTSIAQIEDIIRDLVPHQLISEAAHITCSLHLLLCHLSFISVGKIKSKEHIHFIITHWWFSLPEFKSWNSIVKSCVYTILLFFENERYSLA